MIWRFFDRDPDPRWRVSLSVDFIALETTAYDNRRDFLDRMRVLVGAAETAFGPQDAQRLGLRYIDRLTGEGLEQITRLVKPNVLGIANREKDNSSVLALAALHVLTDALFLADEGQIRARWGNVPAKMTFDPESIEPIQEASWVLDLDVFTTNSQPFRTEALVGKMTQMAERAYSVFREMVTDEFLKFYGGQL